MTKRLTDLVFYDGSCGLCDRLVQYLLHIDHAERFVFAPLQGITAIKYLQLVADEIKMVDSLILIENYRSMSPKTYILAKGALRIAWLLGGKWQIIGILSFLPSWMFNWAYRLIARNRHRLFSSETCHLPVTQQLDRFLP